VTSPLVVTLCVTLRAHRRAVRRTPVIFALLRCGGAAQDDAQDTV
jgi:hypothetical protein